VKTYASAPAARKVISKVRSGTQPVDARVRPEVDEHDPPAQVVDGERRLFAVAERLGGEEAGRSEAAWYGTMTRLPAAVRSGTTSA
jgi:hypothetical protein